MLETLLQYGGSSSTPDRHGYTPIHKAAYNGHDKCLEVMLEVGVALILAVVYILIGRRVRPRVC
jgi:ankyrin repeat protein